LAELVLSTGGPCQISQDVADCCRGWGRYCLTSNQMRCPALWEGLQDRIDLLEKPKGVWLVGMLLRSCLRIPSARMLTPSVGLVSQCMTSTRWMCHWMRFSFGVC